MKKLIMYALFASVLISCNSKKGAQKETQKETFKYLVDEFADIKVMRYQIPNWDSLTLKQKEYIYYLSEAAKCGRDILWDQNFRYNLLVRKTLETIISSYSGNRNGQDYKHFEIYAKRVFFSNGIHHHYAEDKILPDFTADYFAQLIKNSDPSKLPLKKGETIEEFIAFVSPIVLDSTLYKSRKNNDASQDLIAGSATNFYEGLTKREVEAFYKKMIKQNDTTPVSYGLNSKLVKRDGKIYEEVYRIGGLYSEAISEIVKWLELANSVAENEAQRNYTNLLISYYKTGDLKTWDDYNVAWVQDVESTIDFVNGFIEDYGDPMGMKATWESVVNFKDIEATKRSEQISNKAQWFEDNSPIDPKFKKKTVKGVTAKGIIATALGGDCFPTPPIGINLPNADWIRKDYGSKSVTITNLMYAYDKAAEESPKSAVAEFSFSQAEVDLNKKYGSLGSVLHTDLHECLGHGSGQLLPTTQPGALKEYNSSLEEARADLFALYYCNDPIMVEMGILPSLDAAKAEYNSYIRNGLMGQLARIELGKTVTQAHMQARKLIAEWCYVNGKKDNVIEKKIKDNKTYFVINDYDKLRTLFGKLLAEIQKIKSEGNYTEGKRLIETYAVKIDPILHKEVKERYESLGLKPYGGFLNPDIIPVKKNGKVVDYKVEYPDNFINQHLEYGQKYSFLPATR